MAIRTDPSSLSFGARLRRVENELAHSKRRVLDLEETTLGRLWETHARRHCVNECSHRSD